MYTIARRTLLSMAAGAAVAGKALAQSAPDRPPLGFTPDPKFVEQAKALLAAKPAIDLHAHPGVTFTRDATPTEEVKELAPSGAFESRAIADMKAGGMAGGSFAAVADVELLGLRNGKMGWLREFKPGEARASYERQIANLNKWVPQSGAVIALTANDIVRLHREKKIAAVLMVEGGDFLDGDASYVKKAYSDGVRAITLVHYHPNDIGDNQTSEARSGLTAFGRDVVTEMDRVGMVIDVAHVSEDTVRAVLKTTHNPVICSHTLLAGHGPEHPRFVSEKLALEIAAQGGVIGAWPAGYGSATMNDYIEHILTLSRVVGPEHVGFGTDMDGNYKPVFYNYRQMPLLVSELLRRGYSAENTAAFLGGNFLRVFGKVESGRKS